MSKEYQPKGKVTILLAAMKAEPDRVWSLREVASVMDITTNGVVATLAYALRAELIYRGKTTGNYVKFSLRPFDGAKALKPPEKTSREIHRGKTSNGWVTSEDDIRVQKVVPGWVPPKMVCVRLGT